jgi:hypothetical protein
MVFSCHVYLSYITKTQEIKEGSCVAFSCREEPIFGYTLLSGLRRRRYPAAGNAVI